MGDGPRRRAAGHSGLLGGAWGLYGRLSGQTTDGFREHSGVDQGTVYYGATRSGARSLFKLFGFSGRERTELAYLATDEATLETDLRANAALPGGEGPLRPGLRPGPVHAPRGRRRRRSWPRPTTTAPRAGSASGLGGEDLQQYGIDGHFVGLVLGATHRSGRLALNWGAHANDFTRDHFMDVVGGSRAYLNTGLKNEDNTFLKATWDAGRARLWADAQVRHARFEYQGDQPLGSVSWTFFNPKAGVRFDPRPRVGLYASVGRMSREPARSDMLNGEDNATPALRPAGRGARAGRGRRGGRRGAARRLRGPRPTSTRWSSTTRSRSPASSREIGLPVRRNAGRSHRRGVELDLGCAPLEALAARGDGRPQPEPDRGVDAVLRRVRRGRARGSRASRSRTGTSSRS